MASSFKKDKTKIRSFNWHLYIINGRQRNIINVIYRCAKANKDYVKDYDKNKEPSYIQYWVLNSLYGWEMSQELPVNNSEGIKGTSQFNEDFIKNYNEESNEGYLLEVDVQYLEKLHNDLPFLRERMKIEKVQKL